MTDATDTPPLPVLALVTVPALLIEPEEAKLNAPVPWLLIVRLDEPVMAPPKATTLDPVVVPSVSVPVSPAARVIALVKVIAVPAPRSEAEFEELANPRVTVPVPNAPRQPRSSFPPDPPGRP